MTLRLTLVSVSGYGLVRCFVVEMTLVLCFPASPLLPFFSPFLPPRRQMLIVRKEEEDPDRSDLLLIEYLHLNSDRLSKVLHALATHLRSFRKTPQVIVSQVRFFFGGGGWRLAIASGCVCSFFSGRGIP